MGERLNLEIRNKDRVLANCYYHWSGCSQSAIELGESVIEFFSAPKTNQATVENAITALVRTGASLPKSEYNKAVAQNVFSGELSICNRNNGIITISEKEISDTQYWAEEAVIIYLDTKTFDFIAVSKLCAEDYEEGDFLKKQTGALTVEGISSLVGVPFEKVNELKQALNTTCNTGNGCLRIGSTYLIAIY